MKEKRRAGCELGTWFEKKQQVGEVSLTAGCQLVIMQTQDLGRFISNLFDNNTIPSSVPSCELPVTTSNIFADVMYFSHHIRNKVYAEFQEHSFWENVEINVTVTQSPVFAGKAAYLG